MFQLKETDTRTDRTRRVVLVVGPLAPLPGNKLTKEGSSRPTVSNTVTGDTIFQSTSITTSTSSTTLTSVAQPTVIARVLHHLGQVSSNNCNTSTSSSNIIPAATKQLAGDTCTTDDKTTEVETDPHNEVERRRKQKITKNIKALSEILNPPCHCGKATRAEILEMVVKHINELKQKNSDLQSQIDKLPGTTNSEEDLSQKAFELIEENLRLRSLLLSYGSIESSKDPSEGSHTEEDDTPVQQSHHEEEDSVAEERIGSDKEDVLGLHPAVTSREVAGTEEREVTPAPSVVTNSVTVCSTLEERGGVSEREDRRSMGSDAMDIGENQGESSSVEISDGLYLNSIQSESIEKETVCGGEKRGAGSREDGASRETSKTRTERDKGQHNTREVRIENNETATVEQPWPISSLLSDHSRSGATRDHPSFTLPILSPTYIAEHCDQVFFSPQAPTITTSSTSNITPEATHAPLNVSALYTPLPEVCVPSRVSLPSTHTATRSVTTSVCLPTSKASTASASDSIHSVPVSQHSLPQTRQSHIVQPWVGRTHTTTNNPPIPLRSVTTQHALPGIPPHTVCVGATATASAHPLLSAQYSQPPMITDSDRSSVTPCHSSTQHRSRNTSQHSVSRIQPHRGEMYNSQYLDPNHLQLQHNVNPAPLGMYSSSHTHSGSSRDRLHSYCATDSVSLHPPSSFPMHGSSSLGLPQQQHPSSCSSSSLPSDLFYQHPTAATHYHTQHSVHSLHPQPQDSHVHPALLHPHHTHHYHHLHPPTHYHPQHPPPPPPPPPFTQHLSSPHPHTPTMWRPYSDRQRTSTRFNLSDILSPSPPTTVTTPPHVIHQHNPPGGRIPSFFVDHLLDDL